MAVLFVCTGNTCRSPMAEAIYSYLTKEKKVKSAGVFAEEGAETSVNTLLVLAENGIDFKHRAKVVDEQDVQNAQVILTMTASHRDLLLSMYPKMKEKIYTIKKYVTDVEGDVIDPFGGDKQMYQQTYSELYDLIERLINKEEDCK